MQKEIITFVDLGIIAEKLCAGKLSLNIYFFPTPANYLLNKFHY